MTPEILLVFVILITAVVLLATEWIPLEVTALLCLGIVALTGLVSPVDALSGFSNPAVVTIWAVFILSGGLTRTGVAKVIGNFVLKLAGTGETSMIIVIMTTAGVLSAVMNNVAVAALMLPVVMDIASQTHRSPSRLLMPLAYGCLLGGLTTQIGTPPNILVSDALREAGLKSFSFFDFTPVGLVVMFSGIAFMAFIGRHLLPKGEIRTSSGKGDWHAQYSINDRLFNVRVPKNKNGMLPGKNLGHICLGSILGWNVIAIARGNSILSVPGPDETLQADDLLTIEGYVDGIKTIQHLLTLEVQEDKVDVDLLYSNQNDIAEVSLSTNSVCVGNSLNGLNFRNKYGLHVLAIAREDNILHTRLADEPLQQKDQLLVAGHQENLDAFGSNDGFDEVQDVPYAELIEKYHLQDQLVMKVPSESPLIGQTLQQSRLAEVLGSLVSGIVRNNEFVPMPEPHEVLEADDRLVIEARPADLEILHCLEELVIENDQNPDVTKLFPENVGRVEAILSPHTTLEGRTLRQISFREKFGLSVLGIWRRGKVFRTNLRDVKLLFGDSLLLFGDHKKIQLLGQENDFIVLTESAQEKLRFEKMKIALFIVFIVLAPVIIGWVPIYIAAVIGAALMVLTGCLTMEEAYRQIEWKAVFLIAGMLPLGSALDTTGAAKLIAEGVVGFAGPYGPLAVMFSLISLTFIATCFVPTAALVVLMAPIVFNTSANMGLSPYGLVMAIAMAASASFMTPVAHPANIMVMGPGGYRFKDYIIIGGLMTLVTLVVLMLVLPYFWPLQP